MLKRTRFGVTMPPPGLMGRERDAAWFEFDRLTFIAKEVWPGWCDAEWPRSYLPEGVPCSSG